MKLRRISTVFLGVVLLIAVQAFPQVDPGVRSGAADAGGALSSVISDSPTGILAFFNDAQTRFQEVDSVFGMITGENGKGLGPRYNSRSCAACHAQPAVGGTSPSVNPQVADATADGATNTVPSFITTSGPVREARFVYFTDSFGNPITTSPNGGVEDLYTIAGRTDATGCTAVSIQQPNFASAVTHNNVIFRIPTPVFGAGFLDNLDETTLLANQAAAVGNPFGVAGTFNRNGNDGTISRFGWKAQNKSLEIFAGEAYNVEQGVSNELFGQERPLPEEDKDGATGLPSVCKLNPTPEDHTNFNVTAVATPSDTVQFAMFMRLLEAPKKEKTNPGGGGSITNGETLFTTIGCITCHTKTLASSPSGFTTSLSSAPSSGMFTDLEIHHMGSGLADNVTQGTAGGDQFRTSPLWGLGKRIFFLHDGRTSDLLAVIAAHFSTGSEANTTKLNFDALTSTQKQDVLNFLRSL